MTTLQVQQRLEIAADIALIEEFATQADVGEITRTKYRSQLREFSVWLGHPRALRVLVARAPAGALHGGGDLAMSGAADHIEIMSRDVWAVLDDAGATVSSKHPHGGIHRACFSAVSVATATEFNHVQSRSPKQVEPR